MSPVTRDSEKSFKGISRRGLILLGAQVGFVGLLGLRLRYLQVTQAGQYRLLAEENRINIRLIPPARGIISDRNGVVIADNQQNYRVVLVREQADDVAGVLERLSHLIPLDRDAQSQILDATKRRASFVPLTVAENLTWQQISAVSANAPGLPGITPEVGLSRHYPLGANFTHIVGYVGPVSDYDLSRIDDRDPLLQIPKFQIGKSGVERKVESRLRGKAGIKRIEVNAVGRVMREIDRDEGDNGANIGLTVEQGLQSYVQARLAGQSAAAVLMDVHNGDLMTMGSTPSFDPNAFVTGISAKDYNSLLQDPFRPLVDKSVQGAYPPGSTFKMMVALAALEEGLIDLRETVYCPGYYELGNRKFHCWKRHGHGRMNLKDSLKNSCDVFYYDVARRVGIEKITGMAKRFGLGAIHNLPLSGETSGLTPTKAWKRKNRNNASWLIGDTLNAGIGQGFVLASPLQLAVMAARLASGTAVEPRVIKTMDGRELHAKTAPLLGVSTSALNAVRGGMFAVSNLRGGTAFSTRIAEKSMQMAGKTGTSQVRNITAAERARGVIRNADLPWERRDHALFVGFAPFDKPRFSVSVVVEHGGGGSRAAAPIARDIMLQALYGQQPPLSAYPASQRGRIRTRQKKLSQLLADQSERRG